MSFGKVRFGKEEIFTTVVEDIDGRELARWRVNKKDFPKTVKILTKQFGLKMRILEDKDNRNIKEDKDLDWALK